MITTLLHLLRLFPFLCGGHRQLALENLALRQQLAVYKRTAKRPKLSTRDRLFWVWLSRVWAGWRQVLVIVAPDTVLRGSGAVSASIGPRVPAGLTGGRPPVNAEIRALVTRMAAANQPVGRPQNPWRAAQAGHRRGRAHRLPASSPSGAHHRLRPGARSSLTMSETWSRSTSSLFPPLTCASSSSWSSSPTIGGVSFISTPTEHPTAAWTAQQIVEAFPDDTGPSYLLRDRDTIYGHVFLQRVKGMEIREVLTAPQSPWQNPFVERLIGSIRRECLDHVLVLREPHLRRILTRYFVYYHRARVHLALEKEAPDVRPIERPEVGKVVQIPEVGGLHHRYIRRAA